MIKIDKRLQQVGISMFTMDDKHVIDFKLSWIGSKIVKVDIESKKEAS